MISKAQRRRYEEEFKPAYAALMKFYPFTLEDLDGEIWKPIPDYEQLYHISNFGRVKSFYNGKIKIRKPVLGTTGYLLVNLSKGNKVKLIAVHQLVALAFIPNTEGKPEVNHKVGCKFNNYVENLEWATQAENIRHAVANDLIKSGEGNYRAKFTNAQVEYIRNNPDGLNLEQLAAKFGVVFQVISAIQLGKKYRNAGGSIRPKFGVPEEIKKQIRSEYVFGSKEFGCRALAKKYGVDHSTIWKIVNP